MDVSQVGSGVPPWPVVIGALAVVLGVVLGIVLVGALATRRSRNARRRASGARDPIPAGSSLRYREDDLPAFLESPPGSPRAAAPPPAGWPALASGGPAGSAAGRGWRRAVVLAAVALTVLLVVAAVAALGARTGRPGPDRADGPPGRGTADSAPLPGDPESGRPGAGELADVSVHPGRDGGAARLSFGGLLLEQRAVGITATYPSLDVTWNRAEGVAHLQLPTFNCLTTTAPVDPVAAGCVESVTEYADLRTPALAVTGDDGAVQLSGRFPTYVRPHGSPPVWTGRVYRFSVRAAPVAGEPAEGWVRAEGTIGLGEGRAPTLGTPDVTVLRRD